MREEEDNPTRASGSGWPSKADPDSGREIVFFDEDGALIMLTWEEFESLSSERKDEYKNSFSDRDAFFDWMAEAQSHTGEAASDIEIGPDGVVDLGKYQ